MTYPISEDTFLLKKRLKDLELEAKEFLEIGTGSGEIAIEAAKRGADVTAVDRDSEAVKEAKKNAEEEEMEIEVFVSDLFESVDQRYDFIVFNPPYLPGKRESGADPLVGGEKGIELTERFLKEAQEYLRRDGDVFFIGSSLAELDELEEKFELERFDEKELWFETLYLYRLSA